MSKKIKHRQQKKPRSIITMDMILNCKGGPMRDRRERRAKDAKNSWRNEEQ